ncbi:hypothetical protein [Nitrosomonas communis]|uniref:hypothetical protein n=1 Tax=Nitrosomonas communis TaxID=44574 RepID=UPI003D2A4FEF
MTIASTVNTALSAIIANTWAVELPPNPTWPAIIFEIESLPEKGWVQGGGYVQHVVTVVLFTETRAELATLKPQTVAAMEGINNDPFRYLGEEESGDAEFEELPGVYAYYQNFRIRERT